MFGSCLLKTNVFLVRMLQVLGTSAGGLQKNQMYELKWRLVFCSISNRMKLVDEISRTKPNQTRHLKIAI